MADNIKDGTGTGNLAKVDNENRISTFATTVPESTHISSDVGEYYIVCNGAGHDTGTAGWRLNVRNDSETQLLRIQEINMMATGDGMWHMGYNGVVSNGTAIVPTNMNLVSPNAAPVTAVHDSALTFTTNPTYMFGGRFIASSMGKYIEKFNGSLVLGTGSSVSLYWRADSSATIAMAIQFYMVPK